jgi:hypothetical protein
MNLMSARRSLTSLHVVAILSAATAFPLHAENPAAGDPRKVLAESQEASIPRSCTLANCATVLSIRHGDMVEYGPTMPVHGSLKRNPPFGGFDPHVAPVTQPGFMVQRQSDLWLIEVERRDGTIETIRQNHPVFFHAGDEVLVERGSVRVPD